MTHRAKIALRAVELRRTCGNDAARRYAINNGCLALYRLALQLTATK